MRKFVLLLFATIFSIASAMAQPKIVNYQYEYIIFDISVKDYNPTFEHYQFGEEVTVGDKKYLPFISSETGNTAALIRQDGKKCYVLITQEFLDNNHFSIETDDTEARLPVEGEELLIWDCETPVGESYIGLIQSSYLYDIGFCADAVEIASETKYENCGAEWDCRTVEVKAHSSQVDIIDGIGPLQGYMFAPFLCPLYDVARGFFTYLTNVKDKSTGDIIFDSGATAGLDSVGADGLQDSRMYDLTGREIRNPEKGTVYIQGGRKYVAR